MSQTITDEREQVLDRLDEIETTLDNIQRDLDVLLQIHEQLHPEELARAHERVEGEAE